MDISIPFFLGLSILGFAGAGVIAGIDIREHWQWVIFLWLFSFWALLVIMAVALLQVQA